MTIVEVIHKSNDLLFQNTGVQSDPVFVRLLEKPGQRPKWILVYPAKLFLTLDTQEANTTVDGGEYIVEVDCISGLASEVKFGV